MGGGQNRRAVVYLVREAVLPKVLIVDDDRTTVKLLQTLLEMDGFEVAIAPRGEIALELLYSNAPDVVLIDYHLTDMHGVEIVRRLRAQDEYATLPIVMTSGLDMQDEALAAGANAFLIKPFEPSRLSTLFYDLLA